MVSHTATPKTSSPTAPRFDRNAACVRWVTAQGTPGLLVWNRRTGRSVRLEWAPERDVFVRAPESFQLPRIQGEDVRMAPYVAPDGTDVVFTWDAATGETVSWFLDPDEGAFVPCGASYQLPPTRGLAAPVLLEPGVTARGEETVRVWSGTSGEERVFVHREDAFVPWQASLVAAD